MKRLSFVISRTGIPLIMLLLSLSSCDSSDKRPGNESAVKTLGLPLFKDLTDSLSQFPDDVSLYVRRASLLSQHNFHEIANADYKKAWELTSDENIALEYASSLLLTNKLTEGIALLEHGLKAFPANTEFNRRLAEVYAQIGKSSKALEQYNIINQKDPTNFEAWFDKGSLLARMADTSGAIAAMEKSFSILPINYSGLALANLYITRKNPRALEICNILLAKDSGNAQTEPLYMKGVYYSELNDKAKALQQFEECILRDWKMTDAYIEKGIIFFEEKNFELALKTFKMAATVSNTNADAYYWMGRCYESTGNTGEAVVNYERAFALDRSFAEAKEALKRVNG
ncbi:MAG: tetratricopeptide repeat protein [Flavitalea sp.]